MKSIYLLLLLSFFSAFSLSAKNPELTLLIKEREEAANRLKQLNDSVIPGRVLKLYLLNDQMQKVLLTDESIIRHTLSLIESESALNDSLRVEELRAAKLSLEKSEILERSKNDAKMLLILKAAVGVLLLGFLILLYLLLSRKKPQPDDDKEELERLQNENASLQTQLSNYASRETRINEQIEAAVQSKTSSIQTQLDAANERYKSILNKIDKLIRDLSSVSQ